MSMVICFITCIFLICCSISDIRTKSVSAWFIFCGTTIVFLLRFYDVCIIDIYTVIKFLSQSIVIFTVFKIISVFMKNKIGDADFDVLFVICLSIGISGTMIDLICACLLAFVKSLPAIIKDCKNPRNYSIPFIPYLSVGYFIILLISKGVIFI